MNHKHHRQNESAQCNQSSHSHAKGSTCAEHHTPNNILFMFRLLSCDVLESCKNIITFTFHPLKYLFHRIRYSWSNEKYPPRRTVAVSMSLLCCPLYASAQMQFSGGRGDFVIPRFFFIYGFLFLSPTVDATEGLPQTQAALARRLRVVDIFLL